MPDGSNGLKVALLGHSSVDEDFTYAFGLYRLQAYLRSVEPEHEVAVLDRKVTDDEDEDLRLVLAGGPAVIGLGAYLWNLPRMVRLVSRLRALHPEILIVVGGPSAKGFDDLAIDDSRPDLLVVGPGEVTFANILQAHARGQLDGSLAQLGNLISYRGGPPVAHDPGTRPGTLDFLPSPYLMGLVEVDTKTLYVETDRGCPYSCAFCIESTAPNKVSQFSLERVEQELRWALEHGFTHIEMCSAIFNRDSDWLETFVELVERLDPRRSLSFSAALYSTYVDERQVGLLARLNLKSMLFGLNSTNEETFKSVRRVIRLERFRQQIELINRVMRPEVSLIMGLPGDTPAGFAKTLEFAESLDADVMIFRFMVLPATIYYEQRERYRLEIDFDHDNRILSTASYTREDFATMEGIARAAGFEEVNSGQWFKRLDQGMQAPAMDQRTWNLLYLTLRELGLDHFAWPAGWRFERVLLEVRAYVQIKLRGPRQSLDIFVSLRADDAPRFASSRFFNIAYREGASEGEPDPAVREIMARFSQALGERERQLLERKRTS
jgi:radical SAM superfamily enzyme YgiQ (UPF0313 family)